MNCDKIDINDKHDNGGEPEHCDIKDVTDENNNDSNNNATHSQQSKHFQLNIPIVCDRVENLQIDKHAKDSNELNHSPVESDNLLENLTKKTAKEMREIIMNRKKKDPRKEKRKDLKRRVEMIEEL